ncbi:MAG: hypothetical protein QGH73_07525 [Rhodospirillales bacterium]|jgi:N-methylhydantoinase B|nr:hypothetical protein [Rhodospirillales bacterium]MDP6642756.1 hypothetical protein [Rhodospirillales bacterium]MDP6841512.1 hypothetical protein [Rhodospirillales bacterium]|tara:strand:- start:340 stop:660 length:321 start_codon:yes stop_codon:yes gene_type:complete
MGFGAAGGEPSPQSRTYIRRDGEETRVKPHRRVDIKTGDVLVKHSSGGGGGLPAERDPQMVREDLRNELVSVETARDVYKVVIDPVTFEIDDKETRALRAKKAANG